jgi:hypothetical protein
VPKKAQITQERVEYKVFLLDEPLKGSKSLKIFKISLTFRFDKLSNLSKSVHTGENSQILTVLNKKISNFTKLKRIMAYVKRFTNNCRNVNKQTGPLSTTELNDANNSIMKLLQENSWSPELGLLRAGSRN